MKPQYYGHLKAKVRPMLISTARKIELAILNFSDVYTFPHLIIQLFVILRGHFYLIPIFNEFPSLVGFIEFVNRSFNEK